MAVSENKPPEDWFFHAQNFGALPPELSSPAKSRIVLLPVPYESSTTYRTGCHGGPRAVIEASTNMELYDEELRCEPSEGGIYTSPPLDIVDDAEQMLRRVEAVVSSHLERGKFVTVLGGEHSVTLGIVRALRRRHSSLSVLYLDAHADFRQSYRGNKYSHACVARRISELCHIVHAGVRSLSSEEAAVLEEKKAPIFWASDFRRARGANEQEALIGRLVESLADSVHVSIDVDAFDPSIMPAVGTPEPGGLLWDEVLNLLRAVIRAKRLVGLDLVELAPVDGFNHSEFAAARLLHKIWGYAFGGSKS